jgi:hypothetical protein
MFYITLHQKMEDGVFYAASAAVSVLGRAQKT